MVDTATCQVTGYLYPWDILGDPGAAGRIRATGVDRVALAAAYHSVRAATPRHPARRIVDAHSAALYVPPGTAFDGQPLAPAGAEPWTGTDNAFAAAASELRNAGIPVDAWTVLTHSSAAGGSNRDLCVLNAFGEVYSYALCPSQPAVRTYAATVVARILQVGRPDGLVLEAAGPLGFSHQNRHEKTEGAEYSPWVQALLSLCFCAACTAGYRERGLPAEEYRQRVRELVLAAQDPDAAPGDAAGAHGLLPLLEARWDAAAALLDRCVQAAADSGAEVRLSLHATPDPWSTGPFLPLDALRRSLLWPARGDAAAVVPCWGGSAQSGDLVRDMAGTGTRTGAYVLALPPKTHDAGGLAAEWRHLVDAGASELHVYHLGLASTRRLEAVREAVRMVRGRA
ncbi:hypothetical protein GA0061083_1828 [Pseudarthrobacter enclensis]|uniref:Alanine-rich protein n=1 Tax=Pseudarthrobacter enclensis TaxID=993070 RepID=A0A0V8IT53_9MICC|nr:hypothetical protein [Pseudarthrobacter enclensis]KSU77907.1 hypothetical protein AS031_07545 [Pseudarthrobacter enclensis]SCB96181.1 hypothetical protein GA0061083_1828 [Pseudarthrobacter enclensis]